MKTHAETPAGLSGKYLTVVLAEEAYGISVLKVREITRLQKITAVPQMPEFVKGVINLRGRVVPVVDLRVKFGLEASLTERTCLVVVQVTLNSRVTALGLIVDAVEEVANFSAGDVAPPPNFGTAINPTYMLGLVKVKDRVKTLLDIDRVLAADTMETLAEVAA